MPDTRASDAASAARLLGQAGGAIGSHYEGCWRQHGECCLLLCAAIIEELLYQAAQREKTIEAQLKTIIDANHHNAVLTKLVRALRDVNLSLDQKLCSGGVPAVEVVEDGSPTN